ncbi:acetylornithine aminotransferase [Anaplasma marginale str. Dawn]|uniref:Acetylornithine aminotransferase (ArgD) n=2 Tax=Anaplasma marginale TaxID=770 RepID=B9KI05_ANAMF|nr:aspartate aminotransferase family protein [Anaplasma marginale]AAV86410.1 acetylornithine aminotransferase [Anaplasma marginale str. St. Maries]ACM49117.1 acetylornithine aminotransferase (argD) [Anaplasma marginale str. Florida]AGZ78682.1 acetylornithine aminotransferase [Anaplasma marginale str. Gypsy Plains]AGZ79527.1 acetylornithine aminotransferase [Anaplasma marginale str. Dawn]AXW83874.1 acetylornithine transaminase [Anaplasma marginale]
MGNSCIVPFYAPFDVSFARGEGVYLYDTQGKRYIDFVSGIATVSLGHCHPALVNALETQGKTLWHVSNMYRIAEAERLAEKLVGCSFADLAFFCNSGAEAVECGFKIIRSYQNGKGRPERYKILTMRRSFHGRTYAACSANEPQHFMRLLHPYVDWFVSVNPDIDSVRSEVSKGNIGGILVEPVQGQSGVHILGGEFLKGLRDICDEHDMLLFFDCVQCGAGRTGKFFAYEHFGVHPDVCSIAKGMGGGFPIGGCLITKNAGQFAAVGMHGSTFGCNPLATTVAYAAVSEILREGFLENVSNNGKYLVDELTKLSGKFSGIIEEVRGLGLMVGLQMNTKVNVRAFAGKVLEQGLLLSTADSRNVLRMLPPLVVSKGEIEEALHIFARCLEEI